MLTKSFYMYIITILICMGLWTICTLLPYWYASGCYEPSYVDRVLIPVDRGFLVNGYSYRVVGYLFLTDWCLVRLFLDCCNTVFRSPDLSDWVLVILLFVLFTSYLQTTVLVFFQFLRCFVHWGLFFLSMCPRYVYITCLLRWLVFLGSPLFFVCTLALSCLDLFSGIVT